MCTVLLPPGVNPIAVNKYIEGYTRNVTTPLHQPNLAHLNGAQDSQSIGMRTVRLLQLLDSG